VTATGTPGPGPSQQRPPPGDDTGEAVRLPGAVVFEPGAAPARAPALDRSVADALRLLPTSGRLTVLVNDPQRQTASRPVLEQLAGQFPPQRLRVVVAAGAHRSSPAARGAFQEALCGEMPFAQVAWHDSRSDALVPIGPKESWRGHPWLLDGDGLLAIGSVEPHYFAGFTGAHKTATIGVAAHADIEANHAAALGSDCRPARLAGNPVAEGVFAMLASLVAVRPVAAVNLVQAGRSILAAAAGEPLAALRAAADRAGEALVHRVDRAADAVVAEVTGPLGESFYQADKGIKNNEWAVRDGGCMVLVAPCGRGVGEDSFFRLLRDAPSCEAALAAVRSRGYRLGDHKAVRLRHLTDPDARGVRGFIVSDGISAEEASVLGLSKADSAAAALAAAGIDPISRRVYHIRDAGNLTVLPGPREGQSTP